MTIIYAQEHIDIPDHTHSIFLAGPTPRSKNVKSWRPEMLKVLDSIGYNGIVFVPELRDQADWSYEYSAQIEWEEKYLNECTNIVFWVPRDLESLPGFTTNTEFGYWLCKEPSKLIVGAPEHAPKMDYIKYYCNKLDIPYHYYLTDIKSEIVIKASTYNVGKGV